MCKQIKINGVVICHKQFILKDSEDFWKKYVIFHINHLPQWEKADIWIHFWINTVKQPEMLSKIDTAYDFCWVVFFIYIYVFYIVL